jgi:class 3 adenylate cyclase/tetratricopeptide (TPR) repeat protein
MVTCPSCGQENPEGFRLCGMCGTALAPAEPAREVRKTVTVLFSDVQGSTALGEQIDPESLRRAMGRYFEAMRTVLERHGGRVEKFIGDAVMAVFGIPQLHEDDAMRAVRAAAEMQEERERLNEELERDYGVRIESRTGVNTGEVVAGEGETLATGDAVNVAARLEQAAPTGGALIGEQTYRLVRDAVKVELVEPLELKGKAERVAAYRLVEVIPGAEPFARHLDSPMVGRGRELQQLRQAYERARDDRSAYLFTVLGTAGIGKSRLAGELLAGVREEATVLVGRCLPYGEGITYWPLVEILREAEHHEARARIVALLEGEDDAELIASRVEGAIGVSDEGGSSEETFWAVRKLFERLARERPLVVVFDDLHWAEPTFLDLIDHLADWSRGAPMLLLCLARPELLDSRPAWAGGKLNATSILLESLSEEETGTLIDNLLVQVTEDLRERVSDAAEGNPLFVEQMLALLAEDGAGIDVPPTIQALLAARLDRLPREERAVLGCASVEGKVFHRGAVAELSPEEERAAAGGLLMALVRKELIRPDRADFAAEDAFRFRHLLIRDAAYESLPKEARAELHERFAVWLEQKAGERITEYEEILGYHLEQAHRYREELGPLDEQGADLARRAADRLSSAGRRAFGRGDAPAAVKLLERAVCVLPEGTPARAALLPDLADALIQSADFGRVEGVLDKAFDAAVALGDRGLEARAAVVRSVHAANTNPGTGLAEIRQEVAHAISALDDVGDDLGLARAWRWAGQFDIWLGRSSRADEAHEHAIEHARLVGDRRTESESLGWLALAAWWGPLPVADVFRRCEQIREQAHGDRQVEAFTLVAQGACLAMLGRFDEARNAVAEARAILTEIGLHLLASTTSHPAGFVEMLAGDFSAAEETLREGYDELRRIGETGVMSTTVAYLAGAVYEQGRYDEVISLTQVSEENAAADDFASQTIWRGVRAKALARQGKLEEAETLAREAVAITRPSDWLTMRGDSLIDLAEVLRLADRRAEAAAAGKEALTLYEQKGDIVSAGRASALAELAS